MSDRLEALAALAVLVTALFALPVATQAGSQIYDSGVRMADEQAQTRHPVQAVALEGSTSMPADFDNPVYIPAQWRQGNQLHTERVIAPMGVKVGQPMTIWLDDSGKVVAEPQTAQDAELSAVAAACSVWAVIVICSLLLALLIRKRLDMSRDRAWERELHLMAHNDDGWANRHI
ncbi:MAG: hypothetical protein ABWY93_14090 [Mycobacterium sp.]